MKTHSLSIQFLHIIITLQSFTPKIPIKMDRNHVIKIDLKVETMNSEIQKSLQLPHKYHGEESCCIFKVPPSLLEINKDAYEPQIVSIGPYHHGKDLQIIEEHKWRYLYGLLKKLQKKTNEPLKSLLNSMVLIENKIRQSYSETILLSSEDLAEMMVLDGVFLVELFRKFGRLIPIDQDDPIFKMVWVFPFLMRDFLRIENQIPFFVLQDLFNKSRAEGDNNVTLPSLILRFFNYGALRPKEVLSKYVGLKEEHLPKGKHLLDLFRKNFMIKQENGSIGNGKPGQVVDQMSCECLKEMAELTGNEMSGDTSIDPIQPGKKHLKETVALTGNDTPHARFTKVIEPADMHPTETVALTRNDISIEEAIEPEEMLDGVALTRNETLDDGTSIIRTCTSLEVTQPAYMHPPQKVGAAAVADPRIFFSRGTFKWGAFPPLTKWWIRQWAARYETSLEVSQPTEMHHSKTTADNFSFERIQPATKLVAAGVKFKKNDEAKSFLDIKFQNGVLSIPRIDLDDFYSPFILNGMIFEQCYSDCSKDFTTYIVFLGCLINTSMDVGVLSDSKIIQNYLGTDKELVKFFNDVGKYVPFDINSNYLKDVFKEINEYCDNGWYVGWAEFKQTYFDSPWTFISAFAAFVLLCLAGLQTFYTVYPYYYEHI